MTRISNSEDVAWAKRASWLSTRISWCEGAAKTELASRARRGIDMRNFMADRSMTVTDVELICRLRPLNGREPGVYVWREVTKSMNRKLGRSFHLYN